MRAQCRGALNTPTCGRSTWAYAAKRFHPAMSTHIAGLHQQQHRPTHRHTSTWSVAEYNAAGQQCASKAAGGSAPSASRGALGRPSALRGSVSSISSPLLAMSLQSRCTGSDTHLLQVLAGGLVVGAVQRADLLQAFVVFLDAIDVPEWRAQAGYQALCGGGGQMRWMCGLGHGHGHMRSCLIRRGVVRQVHVACGLGNRGSHELLAAAYSQTPRGARI
eukprot:353445-Chlamydomonas_euryale.AAC.22